MIYPIVAIGDPVLKKKAVDIEKDYPKLDELIADMYATMYKASGVGLAAPQIGLSIRLFIVDGAPFQDDEDKEVKNFKKIFINPKITKEEGEKWPFQEGCLSIPGIREDVRRHSTVHITYYDAAFNKYEETYTGMSARIIQHEYDHVEGILFTDHLTPLKKRLLKSRIDGITHGKVDVDYRMKFPIFRK
jgi:peptide deformylase